MIEALRPGIPPPPLAHSCWSVKVGCTMLAAKWIISSSDQGYTIYFYILYLLPRFNFSFSFLFCFTSTYGTILITEESKPSVVMTILSVLVAKEHILPTEHSHKKYFFENILLPMTFTIMRTVGNELQFLKTKTSPILRKILFVE